MLALTTGVVEDGLAMETDNEAPDAKSNPKTL